MLRYFNEILLAFFLYLQKRIIMKTRIISINLIIFLCISLHSQNLELYTDVIVELSSEKYSGRGVVNEGEIKASVYIASKYQEFGLKYFEEDYFQKFKISVNTFPGDMTLIIDEMLYRPGIDFVVTEYSHGISGEYDLYYFDSTVMTFENLMDYTRTSSLKKSFIVMHYSYARRLRSKFSELYSADISGIILLMDSPIRWYVSRSYYVLDITVFWINKDIFKEDMQTVTVNIENDFIEDYESRNIIGYIEGAMVPDSFFVFTAHYDHLGMFGENTFYPGANDNASGVAMLITLANYFSELDNLPDYSIVFIAFGAEESGLLGSEYFVNNPLFPLERIKSLINLDMIADNPETVYIEFNEQARNAYNLMNELVLDNSYFSGTETAPLRAMSDHYFFAVAGVPSIFIALHGEAFDNLHTQYDTIDNLYLEKILGVFNLLRSFVKKYR